MAARIGAAGAPQELLDPRIGAGGQVRAVQEVREGDPAGQARVVWFRQPLAAAATALAWDRAQVDITPPGSGADSYTISRGATVVHTGPETTFTDTGLLPATAYTWTVQAYRGSEKVGTTTAGTSTPARSDLGLTATAASYSQINLAWTDPSGSVDQYQLLRGSTVIYTGTGKSKSDTGLSPSTSYSYTLKALRAGAVIPPTDTATAKTPARPTTQKTITLGAVSSASYQGDGDNRGVGEMYCGYYSGTNGRQKSLMCVDVPADLRNCVSVDKVEISFRVLHAYLGSGGKMGVRVHHGNYRTGFPASFPGGTDNFREYSASANQWLGGAQWLDVTNIAVPGRTTVKEEFRVNGAWGFGLAAPNDSTTYYGYCAGANQANEPQVRFTYTVLA
jgi:hypothetical protein